MKGEIRRRVLEQRKMMSPQEVNEKSKRIQEKLFRTSYYQTSRTIMTYVDFQNEVETRSIIKRALDEGKNIVVPLCGPNFSLLPVKIDSFDDLEKGTRGILEPTKKHDIVDVKKLDIVLVPGITFDRSGHRLGYGLAYYDRFLTQLSPSTIIIALVYSFQLVQTLPFEDHDQKVNLIITENEMIHC
ncbi:MAG: 5-formyltetrahydrofolate cyclo-ligase [Bacillota bacterium]|jgi:5-formyltetrahydrofolate cyclo-ligase